MKTRTVSAPVLAVGVALALGTAACGQDAKPKKEAKAEAKAGEKGDDGAAKKEAEKPGAPSPRDAILAGIAAYNAGDFDKALENMADDVEWSHAGKPDSMKGKDAVKQGWEDWRKSFPDARLAPKQVFASGDLVAVHAIFTGTHKGEFMGTAPTDKPIGGDLLLVARTTDGKTTSIMEYVNFLTVQGQIGNSPEGMPVTPVAEPPSGEPVIIEGEANAANVDVVRAWYAAFANPPEDFGAVVDKYLTPNSVHWNTASGEKKEGADGAKKEIPAMMKAFADVKIDTTDILSAGDYVLVLGTWSGKHVGDLGPFKASNKEFAVDFAELNRLEDGKIAESWGYENSLQFLTQIGAIEMPAPAGEGEGAEEKVATK